MRVALNAVVAAMALAAIPVVPVFAQNNFPVTETRPTGANGETIIRREACGAVEITTVGGPLTIGAIISTQGQLSKGGRPYAYQD